MRNTKMVTVSLTPEQQEAAKQISKELLGKITISGLFSFWITQYQNEHAVKVFNEKGEII
jgi:hypothetical protein